MDASTFAVVAGLVALLGVGAVAFVVLRSDRPLGLRAVLLPGALVLVASLVAAGAAASMARTSRLFSVGHVAYVIVAVALPAVGVALLVGGVVRRARWPVWIVAVALLVPGPVAWYGTHVAPYQLTVERAEVPVASDRTGSTPVRVGVLSDIQTGNVGSYEHRAVTELMALEPDIIVIPGDLYQGSEGGFRQQLPAFRELLGRLSAPGGVYAVRGDTDRGDDLDQLVVGTDVEILDYEVAVIQVGDRTVRLAGNGWRWAGTQTPELIGELDEGDPGDVRLLLAHRPDIVLRLQPSSDVDLTIAGHTHGGQIALPLVGPLFGSTRLPRSKVSGGLHEVDGHALFVSSGVGMARLDAPQVRLFTRPAVGLVVLR